MTDRIDTNEEAIVEDQPNVDPTGDEETPNEVTVEEETTADALGVDEADEGPRETAEELAPPTAETEPTPDADDGEAEEPEEVQDEEAIPETPPAQNPYDLPGDWYVIHSYSGYENKVKANMETRIRSLHLEETIYEVHIPMEDVVEFKSGKKVTVPKKVFPGYLLVRMHLDDESWYAVRNTPGVTGFVGNNNQKPTPLSRREVERFLGVQQEEEKGGPRFKPAWEVGEQVRVVTGPFADFNGIIEDINLDQSKVVVLVNIFGRDTPVELGFDDIQKN